jgi:hypothetical protein
LNLLEFGAALRLGVLFICALLLAGCAGRGAQDRGVTEAARLTRLAREAAAVESIEGSGKARIETRLGQVEIEFEMRCEPGRLLEINGTLAPGFLPFHGDIEVTSTPDTTLAFVNGIPLVSTGRPYPGEVVYPALVAVMLGGDWVLGWLEQRGCEPAPKVDCGEIAYEFDLDDEGGGVKAWTLKHSEPDGSYDGFLYRARRQDRVRLPEILTGVAHPYEVSVYVEYYEISATTR